MIRTLRFSVRFGHIASITSFQTFAAVEFKLDEAELKEIQFQRINSNYSMFNMVLFCDHLECKQIIASTLYHVM